MNRSRKHHRHPLEAYRLRRDIAALERRAKADRARARLVGPDAAGRLLDVADSLDYAAAGLFADLAALENPFPIFNPDAGWNDSEAAPMSAPFLVDKSRNRRITHEYLGIHQFARAIHRRGRGKVASSNFMMRRMPLVNQESFLRASFLG